MSSPFEWYDKHFDEIEIVNPVSRTRMRGEVITTSDPRMLKQLKKMRDRVQVLSVELSDSTVGLRTVRSVSVKVLPPEPCV